MNYNEAYVALEGLVAQLENGEIVLDELSEKVKQANGLLQICEQKLRNIDKTVSEQIIVANS